MFVGKLAAIKGVDRVIHQTVLPTRQIQTARRCNRRYLAHKIGLQIGRASNALFAFGKEVVTRGRCSPRACSGFVTTHMEGHKFGARFAVHLLQFVNDFVDKRIGRWQTHVDGIIGVVLHRNVLGFIQRIG